MHLFVYQSLKAVKRLIILVIGSSVVLVGLVLIVTPGPAILVVPLGLAILAIEFAWARRLLERMKEKTRSLARGSRKGRTGTETDPETDPIE